MVLTKGVGYFVHEVIKLHITFYKIINRLLDQHALNLLFSRVEGGVHDKAETILALCSEMDVSPQEVAYVGDQDSDMRFARAAGCIAVAYLGGVHTKTKLAKAGAQYFLKDFRELKTLPIIK